MPRTPLALLAALLDPGQSLLSLPGRFVAHLADGVSDRHELGDSRQVVAPVPIGVGDLGLVDQVEHRGG